MSAAQRHEARPLKRAAPLRIRFGQPLASALRSALPALLVAAAALLLWEAIVRARDVPAWFVPAPSAVLSRLYDQAGMFAEQGWVTLTEALLGLVVGSLGAFALAILMAHSRFLERGLYPIAIMLKVTPVVVWAPLFALWFGFGMAPKVFIAALITFFPMLVNAVTGLRAISPDAYAFLRSVHASRFEVLWRLRIPSALPYLFAGLRISALLCLIGAVVAEWYGADRGVGNVIAVAHNNLDTATVFAGILTLTIIGAILNAAVSVIERKVLSWHETYLP